MIMSLWLSPPGTRSYLLRSKCVFHAVIIEVSAFCVLNSRTPIGRIVDDPGYISSISLLHFDNSFGILFVVEIMDRIFASIIVRDGREALINVSSHVYSPIGKKPRGAVGAL